MKLLTSFEELPPFPLAFTIGVFDGVHLGHQKLLAALKATGAPTCVITFDEHPLKTLKGEAPPLLMPLGHRLALLDTDYCLLLPFKEVAAMTYIEFLGRLNISHLVLGKGDAFGSKREGTEENVRKLAIECQYIEKMAGVSSSKIRELIQLGNLAEAQKLLGREKIDV